MPRIRAVRKEFRKMAITVDGSLEILGKQARLNFWRR